MFQESRGVQMSFFDKVYYDGSVSTYKACLVAKGFTQEYGIDYMEIFALVAKLNTVRIIFLWL